MIHKHLLICKLLWVSYASLSGLSWPPVGLSWYQTSLSSVVPSVLPLISLYLFLNFVCCQIYREHEIWHHSCPEIKFKIFYSEVSNFRRLNERWHLTTVTYHDQEYSRKCKKHRKYIGTIYMVQNTNVLSYYSFIMFSY